MNLSVSFVLFTSAKRVTLREEDMMVGNIPGMSANPHTIADDFECVTLSG